MRYRRTYLERVDSTNEYTRERAACGRAEGYVVTADFQTNGRGRYKRRWISAPGENLLFSILLRPRHGAHKVPYITLIAAYAVIETIRACTGLNGVIKPPNDVLIDGKKVCGILTESNSTNGVVAYVVLGVGLNVNSSSKTLIRGATSLKRETGTTYDRDVLLKRFLKIFKEKYHEFNA
jgi:BirA family transcriptional regulator, biotin operon repressor / biotin---[acetyl-CoA-carboxylase] ligase